MYYKKEEDAYGCYVDIVAQTRYEISACRRITTPEGVNVGWSEFPSLEAALEAWHLTYDPLPKPESEN